MKLATVLICVTLIVSTQAFSDNFRRLALLNSFSGRSPFDFSGLFGGRRQMMANQGMQGNSGFGNMGMLFLVGGGDGFFGV